MSMYGIYLKVRTELISNNNITYASETTISTYTNTADCMYGGFTDAKFFRSLTDGTFIFYNVFCKFNGTLFNMLFHISPQNI